jgi:hypothetical protein
MFIFYSFRVTFADQVDNMLDTFQRPVSQEHELRLSRATPDKQPEVK